MKISFIGYKNSFHYNKIGGTDAIVRRISNHLAKHNEIYILHYGLKEYEFIQISENIVQVNFLTFHDMLIYIKENKILNSISIYLKPIDRLKLYFFQKKNSSLIFHTLITVFNEKKFKRWALFLESSITYSGNVYCVSNRIYNSMKKISQNAILLLPPVDDSFFSDSKIDVKQKEKIRISYMGRLDYGKGADLAYNYFINSNLDRSKYEFYIYSYPWENDKFSMDLHNKLLKQTEVKYIETKLYSNPSEVDKFLSGVIDETDLFFLPYRFMRSTIDAPLVPMEIMVRNKPFVSTNIGGIKEMSFCTDALMDINELSNYQSITKHITLILGKDFLIQKFVNDLGYNTSNIVDKLLNSFASKDK